jgi:hypothetical protein
MPTDSTALAAEIVRLKGNLLDKKCAVRVKKRRLHSKKWELFWRNDLRG